MYEKCFEKKAPCYIKRLIHFYMIIHDVVEENIFCRYCLQAFSTEDILKRHIKDCFKINGKKRIKMPKKGEYVIYQEF